MKFFTSSKTPRPVRLNQTTRAWAWESMHGKYGEEAIKYASLKIEDENFDKLSLYDIYDKMILKIASEAPVRICEEELVSGSATLGMAIFHSVPAFFNGHFLSGVSHLTIDYETTIRNGVDHYEKKIKQRLLDATLDENQIRFLKSLLNVIEALRTYHKRYLEATKEKKPQIYQNLLRVPFAPASNFHEAVQSLWFIFSFVRLCGNWPGIGRIDYLLGDYLKKDLQEGTLTIDEAREILASMFIKGTEWIRKDTPRESGDAQHYQNILLAGVDENGNEITNEVTFLVLDIVEELGISDFPISVRVSEKTSEKLLRKIAKVIRHGGGVVAVYNEPLVIRSMTEFGYPLKDARMFANDGCWEVQVPGKTNFCYLTFDALALLQRQTLQEYKTVSFPSFEALYNAYIKDLDDQVEIIIQNRLRLFHKPIPPLDQWWVRSPLLPTSVISLFENGCIESAKSYHEYGTVYKVYSPHIGGIADVVNSLYAIKKAVFDEKIVSFEELADALIRNWEGCEELKARMKGYRYYGTDNDEVDGLYKKLAHDFYLLCKKRDENGLFRTPAGISTFGREIYWLPNRLASPHGSNVGTILAGNTSPTPGTDTEGATAVIKSYCKADLSEMTTGAALDLKISPQTLVGENGLTAIKELIRGFVRLGGYFIQIDTVSAETLKKAQENPSEYKTLSVRVSGWNARFITLNKEWQDMIIQRTAHNG